MFRFERAHLPLTFQGVLLFEVITAEIPYKGRNREQLTELNLLQAAIAVVMGLHLRVLEVKAKEWPLIDYIISELPKQILQGDSACLPFAGLGRFEAT